MIPTPEELKDIENRFAYHAATGDQPERYNAVRNACKNAAEVILTNVPNSRERSAALTDLEKVMFMANAGIARQK